MRYVNKRNSILPGVFIILFAILSFVAFVWGGTTLCNYALTEFLGDDAPQPSVAAWAVFWLAVFIVRNFRFDLKFEGR